MIRVATKDDVEAIYSIEIAMFDESTYVALTLDEIKKLLNKKSTYLYVYCDKKNIPIGYSLGININNSSIWFNSLAVLKEHQSTDAAKLLFQKIEATCTDLKFKSVILEIRKDNKALLRRYKNMGYEVWKEILNYYPDGCEALRMTKCIK